jgi:iron complex outermembrane receptor protein
VARYQFNANANAYISYSEGFKTGAYTGYPPNLVGPEHVRAYEIGYKQNVDKLVLTAAAFYYDYRDAQVSTFDFQTGLGITVSVPKQADYGAELELAYRLTDSWTVSASGAYLNAQFIEFPNASIMTRLPGGGWGDAPQSANGTPVPRAPNWTGDLSSTYDLRLEPGVVEFTGNVSLTSSFYEYFNRQFVQPGYAKVDLGGAFIPNDAHWRFSVFVTNLTDVHNRVQYNGGPTGLVAFYAAPRIFGGSVKYKL